MTGTGEKNNHPKLNDVSRRVSLNHPNRMERVVVLRTGLRLAGAFRCEEKNRNICLTGFAEFL